MKNMIEDLKTGFRLVFHAKSIKEDAIFYLVTLILGLVMLTGSAIARNTFDNGFQMVFGTMAYAMGVMGILSDYNGVLFSDFLLASPQSKKLQIKIHLEMSMVLFFAAFSLMALIELCFAGDCCGDVLLHLSLFFAFMMILTGGSRKRYARTVLIVLIPMGMIIGGGMSYFFSGFAVKEFSIKNCMLWETWLLSFFRGKAWRAIATGYLILLVTGLIQYLELRYCWKIDGGKLYYAMKKNH